MCKKSFASLVALTLFIFSLATASASADDVYSANFGSSSISHLVTKGKGGSTKGGSTTAVSCSPFDLALNAPGTTLFGSCRGGAAGDQAFRMDVASGTITTMGAVASPSKVALCMNDAKFAVTSEWNSGTQVTIFSTANNAVSDTITYPDPNAFSTFGVSCSGSLLAAVTETGHVFLYDISAVPATLVAESSALFGFTSLVHVAFAPGGAAMYVLSSIVVGVTDANGNPQSGNVLVYNVPSLAIRNARTVAGGSFNPSYAAPVDGHYMYVSAYDGSLTAFDTSTDALLNTLAVGTPGSPLAGIASTKGFVYVAFGLGQVASIARGSKPQRDRISRTYAVGNSPYGVAAH